MLCSSLNIPRLLSRRRRNSHNVSKIDQYQYFYFIYVWFSFVLCVTFSLMPTYCFNGEAARGPFAATSFIKQQENSSNMGSNSCRNDSSNSVGEKTAVVASAATTTTTSIWEAKRTEITVVAWTAALVQLPQRPPFALSLLLSLSLSHTHTQKDEYLKFVKAFRVRDMEVRRAALYYSLPRLSRKSIKDKLHSN